MSEKEKAEKAAKEAIRALVTRKLSPEKEKKEERKKSSERSEKEEKQEKKNGKEKEPAEEEPEEPRTSIINLKTGRRLLLCTKEQEDMSLLELTVFNRPTGWPTLFQNHKQEIGQIDRILRKPGEWGYYPAKVDVFNAYHYTGLDEATVVILGQDPYPTPGHAMGMSFSLRKGFGIARSLVNIFWEIRSDYPETPKQKDGDLTRWTGKGGQGVMLLNAGLTFDPDLPEDEKKRKESKSISVWKPLIIPTLAALSEKGGVVFMLWGGVAQGFSKYIKGSGNLILEASHPSPFSYDKGEKPFKGCGHFRQANDFLESKGKRPIVW